MSEIMDRYIDRMMLIEELQRLGQDFIDAEVDSKVMAGLSSALRHIKSFPAADVKKGPRWIPVTPQTMPPENEYGLSKNLILRTRNQEVTVIYVGFTSNGVWNTAMQGRDNTFLQEEDWVVTHWMYADDMPEVQ